MMAFSLWQLFTWYEENEGSDCNREERGKNMITMAIESPRRTTDDINNTTAYYYRTRAGRGSYSHRENRTPESPELLDFFGGRRGYNDEGKNPKMFSSEEFHRKNGRAAGACSLR